MDRERQRSRDAGPRDDLPHAGVGQRPAPLGREHVGSRVRVAAHMLRHATGYKLANDGQDTRAIQHYLGHKNIAHTTRYTNLAPDRFKTFWRD